MRIGGTDKAVGRRRGVALLLVMIAMVVCLVLVTGFLSAQGTANGIARNEGEYARAQRAAETGVNMCLSYIKNRSDWRSAMSPGTWLDTVAVGSATVIVTAADAGGNGSFLTDPTKGVVFTATGAYNGRTARLVATAQPTGAGTVFNNGAFAANSITLDKLSYVDSFNSANGAYSILLNSGNSALLSTASTANGAVTLADTATLLGSVQVGATSLLSNVLNLGLGVTGPSSTSAATETRTAGEVVAPNTTGLTSRPIVNMTSGGVGPTSGTYASVTMSPSGLPTMTVTQAAATVRVTGGMSLTNTTLSVANNAAVTYVVDGNVSWTSGGLTIGSGATVTIVTSGNFTASGAKLNYSGTSSGTPGKLMIYSTKAGGGVTLKGTSQVAAGVVAPQSDVVVQDTAQVYGGIIGKSLKITDTGKLHWDTALKTKAVSNIINGSASPGTAVYAVSYQWNP